MAAARERGTGAAGVIDVSRPLTHRTFVQGVVSLAGAVGLALLAPFAVLLVGLPVVVGVRALLDAISWLSGVGLR
jgi:hypothetical protein